MFSEYFMHPPAELAWQLKLIVGAIFVAPLVYWGITSIPTKKEVKK